MSLLRKKKKVSVTAPSPTYRVRYLGNVATTTAQLGEEATSRPVKLLWDNHVKTSGRMCVPMTISVDSSGISVRTESRGASRSRGGGGGSAGAASAAADRSESMHYWCHRVSAVSAIKEHPGLFIWVYRHAGRNMKVELRCHAALCKSDKAASELAELVARVLRTSLGEYVREKQQSQRRRSLQEKVAGFFTRSVPLRKQLLSPGRSYKPPVDYCFPPQQLDVIKEDRESCTSDEADPSAAADGGAGSVIVMDSAAGSGVRGSRLDRVVGGDCYDDDEDESDIDEQRYSIVVGNRADAREVAIRTRSASDSEAVGVLVASRHEALPLDALARTETVARHSTAGSAAATALPPLPLALPVSDDHLPNGRAASKSHSRTNGSAFSAAEEDMPSSSSSSSSSSGSGAPYYDGSGRSSFQTHSMSSSHHSSFPQALHFATSAVNGPAQHLQQQQQLQRGADTSTFHIAGSLPDMSVTWVSYDEECNFEPGGPAADPAETRLSAAAGLAKLLSASHLHDGEYL